MLYLLHFTVRKLLTKHTKSFGFFSAKNTKWKREKVNKTSKPAMVNHSSNQAIKTPADYEIEEFLQAQNRKVLSTRLRAT